MKPQPNRKRIACLAVGLLVLLALAVPAHAEVNATPVYMSGPNIDAVNAYNQAGDLAAQGKLEDALKETERALSIQPNFSLALAQKAGLQNALGNYTEGLASADAALKGNPDIAEAWANRADALVHLGKVQDAIDSANKALALDPTIEGAKATKLVAEKIQNLQSPPSPTATTKAPVSIVAVIGALCAGLFVAWSGKPRS